MMWPFLIKIAKFQEIVCKSSIIFQHKILDDP